MGEGLSALSSMTKKCNIYRLVGEKEESRNKERKNGKKIIHQHHQNSQPTREGPSPNSLPFTDHDTQFHPFFNFSFPTFSSSYFHPVHPTTPTRLTIDVVCRLLHIYTRIKKSVNFLFFCCNFSFCAHFRPMHFFSSLFLKHNFSNASFFHPSDSIFSQFIF